MPVMWLILLALLIGGQDELSELAAQGRWEELAAAASDRLDLDPSDDVALYWSGRASIERARVLLEAQGGEESGSTGRLAGDLARSLLSRALDRLSSVRVGADPVTRDAPDWAAFARYLDGRDAALAADMEDLYARQQSGYAAYLRGLIAADRGDRSDADWFGRAVRAEPTRDDFALAWALALGRRGERDAALAAWEQALAAEAPRPTLLAALLTLLPGTDNAADRLARLQRVADEPGASDDALLAWYLAYTLEQLGRAEEGEALLSAATGNRSWEVERAHARLLAVLDRAAEALPRLGELARQGDLEALEQLVGLGDQLAQERRWDEALAAYEMALSVEPRHLRAAGNRALTLSLAGRTLDGYRELVDRHPRRADLLNDAALAAWGWGRPDEARTLLERATLLEGALDARENLAALLLETGADSVSRARGLLEQVLAEEPERDRALFLLHRCAANALR
jgi:hypothetical protein